MLETKVSQPETSSLRVVLLVCSVLLLLGDGILAVQNHAAIIQSRASLIKAAILGISSIVVSIQLCRMRMLIISGVCLLLIRIRPVIEGVIEELESNRIVSQHWWPYLLHAASAIGVVVVANVLVFRGLSKKRR